MLFPASLGGSSLSKPAFERLQECPVADPPCDDQQVRRGLGCAGAGVGVGAEAAGESSAGQEWAPHTHAERQPPAPCPTLPAAVCDRVW